jgi:non-heme chloroperoxidase
MARLITSRYISSGDARLHYLDSGGDDHGAPIVFVPGMTDIADDYTQVLPLFGRRMVVVEVRGHGRSSSPVSGYDLATLSRDVGAVVDAVTDGPVHIVTFSRGTSCAVAWAIEHPDRVRSISIGDYVPEERVGTHAASLHLLDGRWRGTPVSERLDVNAAMRTSRYRAYNPRCSWSAVATACWSLMRNGPATDNSFPAWNWSTSTTRPTTSSARAVDDTPGWSTTTSTEWTASPSIAEPQSWDCGLFP